LINTWACSTVNTGMPVDRAGFPAVITGFLAPRDPGVAVGHMQSSAFMSRIDELDAPVFGGVYQGKDGVTDDGGLLYRCLPTLVTG